MLAKNWKKIGMLILIIACMWNIISKLVNVISFDAAISAAESNIRTSEER